MAKRPRLLDLFCGAGGCAVGYHRAGFDVVGVDLKPMKRYPFEFHQGDALSFLKEHGHEFDAIHASPPCQAYCALKHMPNAKHHPELVEPTRELLKKSGKFYVIENVPGAPLINPTMLCGTMFNLGTGNAELRRHRLFETNWPLILPLGMHCKHGRRAAVLGVYGGHSRDRRRVITVTGSHGDAGLSRDRQARARRPSNQSLFDIETNGDVIGIYGTDGRGRSVKEIVRDQRAREDRKAKTVTVCGNAVGKSKRDGLLYFSTEERNEAMQINWMKGGEISQAIPPAYTEFIGKQLIHRLQPRVPAALEKRG